jgi:ubiquinone/menaquinone biosynthesis C-methylase UbiE
MIDKQKIKDFFNNNIDKIEARRGANSYYHGEMRRYYQFYIQPHSRILELGCGSGNLISSLNPSYGVGVDISEKMIELARKKCPEITFVCEDIESFDTNDSFDYIIISGTLANVHDIHTLLQKVFDIANPDTRILIDHYNELWRPVINYGQKLNVKSPEYISNWLSIDDIDNFLYISKFQVVHKEFFMLVPKYLPIISAFFNKLIVKLPIIRRLCLSQLLIARKYCPPENVEDLSVSVIFTVRDEEGNIEPLVTRTPQLGRHTELVFIEGHSGDGTVDRIKDCINKYPEKNIKLYHQEGIGQKDAYRLGFNKAEGDLLCWLEADLTTPPEEMRLLWDTYIAGQGEYINGSRLVYEMKGNAMPLANMLGNRFFGNIFTLLLGQRFTDTLCGLKAISKRNFEKMGANLTYFGDFDPFGDFELIFNAIKLNLKVAEVPLHYQQRTYGESKAYGKSTISFLKHALLLMRMTWVAFIRFKLL